MKLYICQIGRSKKFSANFGYHFTHKNEKGIRHQWFDANFYLGLKDGDYDVAGDLEYGTWNSNNRIKKIASNSLKGIKIYQYSILKILAGCDCFDENESQQNNTINTPTNPSTLIFNLILNL